MEKSAFVPGDLVLANLPVPKRPSQRRDGYWPGKITRKLQNCSRQVKCYATQEVCKVPIQSIVVYNKENIKTYLGIQVDKDSVLAQALAEIKADFVAKSLSAEEMHLSRESKLVTSVVKSPRLLESIDVGSTLLNLWNYYVEKSIGNSWGMCHLKRFIEDFIKEHKEVILGEEIYRDLMLHVCSLEEVGLISSIEVKSIVESLTELNGRCIKDASSNNALDAKTDSTQPLLTECPDIIDVDIDSPIEITSESQSKDLRDGPSAKPKRCVEKKLVRRVRMNPVEQWLDIMENNGHNAVGINSTDPGGTLNYSSVLPFTLNWIANNELHPNPEDCGGVDYAAIYKYLACVCQGEAPPDLNPATTTKVLSLLPMVAGVVKKMDLKKEEAWLENYRGVYSARSYARDPSFDAEKESVENIESLSRIPGLNPLGIGAEVCVDKVLTMPN